MLVGAIAFVVLILVPVAIGVVIAERRSRQMKGNQLRRGKGERHAISRMIVGMGRWGSGGGGAGGAG
jgi:hypothetical protein